MQSVKRLNLEPAEREQSYCKTTAKLLRAERKAIEIAKRLHSLCNPFVITPDRFATDRFATDRCTITLQKIALRIENRFVGIEPVSGSNRGTDDVTSICDCDSFANGSNCAIIVQSMREGCSIATLSPRELRADY